MNLLEFKQEHGLCMYSSFYKHRIIDVENILEVVKGIVLIKYV